MVYYNVIRPCVVGRLHYASVPAQPIEVDDEVAAPLVESGDLAVYGPGETPADPGTILDGILAAFPEVAEAADAMGPLIVDDEPESPAAAAEKPRTRRRKADEE